MAIWKLLWKNTCRYWKTTWINPSVATITLLLLLLLLLLYTAPNTSSSTSNSTVSDSSSVMCILPNCNRPKYTETNGKIHPYCGQSHAMLAKQLGIFRKQHNYSYTNSNSFIIIIHSNNISIRRAMWTRRLYKTKI